MSKAESPPFRMVIERGRLVPATAYDQERLDTYRHGTSVRVRFVEEKDRVMVRKWFAILGKAVKDCSTPWKTKDEASEAIKLALGIVNLTKTVGGEFMAYPKSLVDLTDPELDEAVEQMMAVVYRVTGVDPADWKKEIADIGEDVPSESPPSDVGRDVDDPPKTGVAVENSNASGGTAPAIPDASDDSGGAGSATYSAAATPSANAAGQAGEVVHVGLSDASPAERITHNLMVECLDKFLQVATDPKVPDPKDRRGNVVFAKNVWKDELKGRQDFVKACFETADQVVKGLKTPEDARTHLESLVA